jgi:endonuclease/exonuclease/phosphatase family metal-dependent hydrolase
LRIKIVTYNIHRAIGMDRRFRPKRIVEILAHHRPDVALLQEVDEGVPRSKGVDLAQELAERLEYPHYAVGHNVSLRKGRYGNATLSRYPIVRERNIDLTIDTRKRRGCQHATVRVEKMSGHPHQLELFNLHLGLSARERARQVGLLVRSGTVRSAPTLPSPPREGWTASTTAVRSGCSPRVAAGCASPRWRATTSPLSPSSSCTSLAPPARSGGRVPLSHI